VTFTLRASETNAPGALHYEVSYGDGTQAANVTPDFCVAGPGKAASQTWSLTHQYTGAGTYTVTASVGVNCSPDNATASVHVRVIG
jgi:PKD domain-containing protein